MTGRTNLSAGHIKKGNIMTAANNDEVSVRCNQDENRYEINIGDEVAILLYRKHGDTITLIHTEVPPSMGGKGIGNKLAQFALEDARAQNLQVVASCPFVAAYVRRHPDYMSLLTEAEKQRLSHK